jgi:hypothetical protein
MKQIKISSSLRNFLRDHDVLPSTIRKTEDLLFHGVYDIADLCKKSEQELRSYKTIDDAVINTLKNILSEYGLKLGMTDEEIYNYEDAEYYTHYPDKRPEGLVLTFEVSLDECDKPVQDDVNKGVKDEFKEHKEFIPEHLSEQEVDPQLDNQKVVLTDSLKQRLLYIKEKKYTQKYTEYINNRGNIKFCPEDIEFMFIHIFRTFLMDQPWYVRLFKKMNERIEMAKEATEIWLDSYKAEIVKAQVKGSLEQFSQELDNCWDKNWQNYIKDLKR